MEKLKSNTRYIIVPKATSNKCKTLRKISVINVYDKTYEFIDNELMLIEDFNKDFEIIEKI